MRFPTKEVLAGIMARAQDSVRTLKLPDLDAEEAWVLTEFLDEVQEAIWMDYGDAISDYLDARSRLDCYHSQEDDDGQPAPSTTTEDIDF